MSTPFIHSTVPLPDGIVIGCPWPNTIITWPNGNSRQATKQEYDLFQALEQAHASRWKLASIELPPVNEQFGESEFLLCIERGHGGPVVAWYNSRTQSWTVAHHSAPNIPIQVEWWMPLPNGPELGE
jgi:hypothetical protein